MFVVKIRYKVMLRFIKQDFIVLLCFGGSLINFEYDRTDVSEVTDFNKLIIHMTALFVVIITLLNKL